MTKKNATSHKKKAAKKADQSKGSQQEAEQESVDSTASASQDAGANSEGESAKTSSGAKKAKPAKSEKPSGATDAPEGQAPSDKRWYQLTRAQKIGGGVFAAGATALLLLMAHSERVPHGSLLGLLLLVLTCAGLLGLIGFLKPAGELPSWRGPEKQNPLFALHIMGPVALVVLATAGPLGGYDSLPYVIIAALSLLIPAALQRPGLAVFVVSALIYVPLLGTFSLWDPWETHYGEVAREIVSRDDWISLWWAHENWFWSKPILIFWSESFWLSALGVDVMPDANPSHPEWAIRLPVMIFSLSAVMVVYGAIKRIFGTRAGTLSALALATAPHFFMLSHQAITDMYLVSNVTMALSCLALAVSHGEEEEAKEYRVLGLAVGLRQVVLGGIAMLTLPQAFYLITRNITFYPSEGFALHRDTFLYGSGHNDGYDAATNEGVPGLARHAIQNPAIDDWWAQPISQGIIWLLILSAVFYMLRKERRVQALYMMAFYAFCALAFMGKTIPGVALPGMVALFYLIGTKRWKLLYSGALKVAPGILVVLMIAMPWFVAMFMRHASGFTDRLLVHDNINRVAAGVHGDTGSIQYFMEQLGFGLFPWVGLVPAAVLAWVWMRSRKESFYPDGLPQHEDAVRAQRQHEALMLFGLWFFSAFTLFSAMITKFHHYIFPAVPPAAILSGVLLDRFFGKTDPEKAKGQRWITAAAMLAPAFLIAGFGSFYGDLRGVISEENQGETDWVLSNGLGGGIATTLVVLGIALMVLSGWWLWRRRASTEALSEAEQRVRDRRHVAIAVAVGGGAVILAFVARDLSWITAARPHGFERIIHLFVYNYGRPWPEQFDYRPILTGFGITATVLFALMAPRWTRAVASRAALGTALLFSAWCLNVYMPDLAPHWGMENLFERYYEERSGPEEPVLAFQMNWKGENFYTGNRVHTFVDIDPAKLREWADNNRGKTIFVVTERGRVSSLRRVFPGVEVEEMTTMRENNKFMLFRLQGI